MHCERILLLSAALLLCSVGAARADVAKGDEAYSCGDYSTALAEWKTLAENGDPDAQFGMGLLYANGFGAPMDDDQALKWYGRAAEQGHAQAQCNLAVMHANGWGVPQSDAEALKWYTSAAENGITAAQVGLANMHRAGMGVEQSNVEAYKWFSIAAEMGDQQAGFDRDTLAQKIAAEDKSTTDAAVAAWLDAHASAAQASRE